MDAFINIGIRRSSKYSSMWLSNVIFSSMYSITEGSDAKNAIIATKDIITTIANVLEILCFLNIVEVKNMNADDEIMLMIPYI